MGSGSSEYWVSPCGHFCAVYYCPVCGFVMRPVRYQGKETLPVMSERGFSGFMVCFHVDLHDKVVGGVNYRGKLVVNPIFHD